MPRPEIQHPVTPNSQSNAPAGDIDISVVIPAYYGAATIADCVRSVQQATKHRRCEIIVVDSSGDATADILRDGFRDVRVVQSAERLSAGGARNRGVSLARGRTIFFTDQDCLVPIDWIDRLEAHLQDPAVGGAGGAVGIRDLSNLSGCAMYFLEFLNQFPGNGPARQDVKFLVGCNSGYRVDALNATGFPDQTLAEDVLLSYRIRRAGYAIVYDPHIEIGHLNRTGWREFFRYNRKMGVAAASYHREIQPWWSAPFLRVPELAFFAPLVIVPLIARNLRWRWSYLWRFLLLSPMCVLGNLVWAEGFRAGARSAKQRR